MDLVSRVLLAIETQPVDPAEFERCACALLQLQYPGLSAVEGGHDFGRDADIYFPLADADASRRGRLLVTTGDPAANLRTGLRRMREEGLIVDLVVIACLRPVNASARASLDRICREYDLDPPHIYAHDWLVARLVHEPVWRQRLLGVTGKLGALLERPLQALEQVTPEPQLIGREGELAALHEMIAAGSDVVVTGVPGVGKTRLTAELTGRVTFLEQAEPGQVVDELLLANPAAVVIDDAHARLDELRVLRRARHQESLSFSIVATTWPDTSDDVVSALVGARVLFLDLLELTDMNALVVAVGVTGHRARAVVLHQAEGRPGWALALCELIVKGDGRGVVSGAAHLANVERFLRRATESETALDALACVAALGYASAETLHELASMLGLPPADLVALMKRLARNGLVDHAQGGWHLQPALRAPLVARWFFSDPPGRPWPTLRSAFPDRSLDLAKSVIAAAEVGSPVARRVAETWATSLPDPTEWRTMTFAVVADYSTLDEDAARWSVGRARAALAAPRQLEQVGTVSLDPVGVAATEVLIRTARTWLLPEAVSGLLDLAVDDARPRPQTTDHPLRVLGDLARRIDPDLGTNVEIRERVLTRTLDWLADNRGIGEWIVAAELIATILSVEVSGSWNDPAAPYTVTLSRGVDTAENLEWLLELWHRMEQALDTDRNLHPPGCPPEAFTFLVDLAGEWLNLGEGISVSLNAVTEEQKQAGARGGRMILESLRPDLQRVPGLAMRAQHLINDLGLRGMLPDHRPPAFDLDPDLADLLGLGNTYLSDDVEAQLHNRASGHDALAQRLAGLGPIGGTARFSELQQQARLAVDYPPTANLAGRMGPYMMDPAAWYEAALTANVPPLLRAALVRCLTDAPAATTNSSLRAALDEPGLRWAAVSAALERIEVDDATALILADLRAEDARLLDRLFLRSTADEVLHRLLLHPVPVIAGTAALSFAVGQKHGPNLPEHWQPAWRDAIRGLRADDLDQHSKWRTGKLLEHLAGHDPNLFEEWFVRRLDEMDERRFLSAPSPRGCEQHLAKLPQPHRERLARRCAGRPWVGTNLLTHLLGRDRELAECLLHDGTIAIENLLEVVAGQRNEVLEEVGPVLLDRGVAPERIAAVAGITYGWRGGPDSALHQRTWAYFTELGERAPGLLPVANAGTIQQAALREAAEDRERQDRIRGE